MALTQKGHRSGPLKQTNKSHKTGRHRSKGSIDNAMKGKVSVKGISKRHRNLMKKDQRRHQANQIRKQKREDVFSKKRLLGGSDSSPFLVGIVPLNLSVDPNSALSIIETCDPEAMLNKTAAGVTHISIPRFKQRFAFIVPPVGRGKEISVLDYLKVCDTTILLVTATSMNEEIVDRWGKKIFNMAIAQGLPTPIFTLMDLESINPKKRIQLKAEVTKIIQKLIPDEKPIVLDSASDGLTLLRRIGGQKKNLIHNKANRPHLLGENVEFVTDDVGEHGELLVSGYLRGQNLNVNQLIHVPGLGDFQMSQIDLSQDPNKNFDQNTEIVHSRVLDLADPDKQTQIVRENIPDEMDGEQNFPTEDEIEQSNKENKKIVKRIPKGMSEYQAAWIPEIEVDDEDDDDQDDDDDCDDEANDDFMSCESDDDDMLDARDEYNDEEFDTVTLSEAPVNDEKYDQEMDLNEEQETLQKIKAARIDAQWPDQVDTPADMTVRERYQKYRGLESFRTSPWDVKENLPYDYARIFQFQNFDRTKRRILKESTENEGAQPGWYITIHIRDVRIDLWDLYKKQFGGETLVVYGMLPHEHQMSVMNAVIRRTPDSNIPIKSKERLIFQCGYRRFAVNPIFSQHTNGSKHKYERYFQENSIVVATFYAPIQFPPAPILCFRENPDSTLALVGTGSLLSCTPDRIILKRSLLSGHPFKINRRSATVRYMFFNKQDVDYFKPIKLRTRSGRVGHIVESLGTHGHMKCRFDQQLKSFDTVFMYLYKRVFPKWTYDDCLVTAGKPNEERPKSVVEMEE